VKFFRDTLMIKTNIEQINIKDIDVRQKPYFLRFERPTNLLEDSIKAVGIINPPLLSASNSRLSIITGYGRILASKNLGFSCIPCQIVTEKDISYIDSLLINLYDNLVSRGFNTVEKAMAISRLESHLPKDEIIRKYMPALGLSGDNHTFDLYLRIEKQLDNNMKRWLVNDVISFKTLISMFKQNMSPEDISLSGHLISRLKLNFNYQRQFIDILSDLSMTKGISVSKILADPRLEDILEDTQTNQPQKSRNVIDYLKKLRYPRLSDAEMKFKKKVRSLNLPAKVQIKAPPFFEAEGFRLEVNFKDGEELVNILKNMVGTRGLKDFCAPWEDNL